MCFYHMAKYTKMLLSANNSVKLTKLASSDTILLQINGGGVSVDQCVYTVKEVAGKLKVSEKTVYTMVRDCEMECIHVRGQIRITAEQLDSYLGGCTNGEETKSSAIR